MLHRFRYSGRFSVAGLGAWGPRLRYPTTGNPGCQAIGCWARGSGTLGLDAQRSASVDFRLLAGLGVYVPRLTHPKMGNPGLLLLG